MKKIISLVLAFVIVLGLCACGSGGGGGGDKGLKAGYAIKSITPTQNGIPLAGGDSSRMSEGFLDEISAVCVAISKGDTTYLLITLDYVLTVKAFLDPLEAAITAATGIPADRICTYCWNGEE